MAEAPKPEDASKAPQQEKKEEKKPVGTLESVVNEVGNLLKSGVNLGLATSVPFAQATAFPFLATDTYSLAGAQVLGDATTSIKKGKKFTSYNTLESSIQGTLITPIAYPFFYLINKIPTNDLLGYITKGTAWGAVAYPTFMGIYQYIDYIIKNRTFRGAFKYLKENYWTALKNAWKTVMPLSLLNIFFVPLAWQIPVGAALSYVLTLFGAPKKGEIPKEQQRDKTPYLVAAPRALGKGLKSIFYGVPEAIYAIGSGVKDSLYKAAPKPASPVAQPA